MDILKSEEPSKYEFFDHFFINPRYLQSSSVQLFPYLKQKFKFCKQASYNTPKSTLELNYIRKFQEICKYMPFVSQFRAQKIDICLLQNICETIYNDYETFFIEGGWKVVKNKSLNCHLQQYLLIKLAKQYANSRIYQSLDKFVVCFFFTLNYFKTCNYQIRLFCEFLGEKFEFDFLFIFLMLRKKSQRFTRDLFTSVDYVTSFVRILKSDSQSQYSQIHQLSNDQNSFGDDFKIKQVRLLLLFAELVEYIQNNSIVITEIMIFNLVKCTGLVEQTQSILEYKKTNWKEFFEQYFQEICRVSQNSYKKILLATIIEKNFQLADKIFENDHQRSCNTFTESINEGKSVTKQNQKKQKYLEQSFTLIINLLENIFNERPDAPKNLQQLYNNFSMIYNFELVLVNKLVKQIFKQKQFFLLFQKYTSVT